MLSKEDRATSEATCTKIGEVQLCGFQVMRADRQTNRQINFSITILCTLPGVN